VVRCGLRFFNEAQKKLDKNEERGWATADGRLGAALLAATCTRFDVLNCR
jgi:hypothetical protein